MSLDLKSDPRVLQCLEEAKQLRAVSEAGWEMIRRASLTAVRRWEYATGDYYPALDPLGPETGGYRRGTLVRKPRLTGYRFGFDSAARLVVNEQDVDELRCSTTYLRYEGPRVYANIYEEMRDASYHRSVSVAIGEWLVPEKEQMIVRYARPKAQSRMHVMFHEPEHVLVRLTTESWNNFETVHEYEGRLDSRGLPVEVWSAGRLIYPQPGKQSPPH